jgi:cytosine/adenosine deaminase-related metal-dependent hydrolase
MSYRKFKADYLFDGTKMCKDGAVLVCRSDGTIESILSGNDPVTDVEEYSGMIVPGFINCHCHLELSYLKGLIPEKSGLVDFILAVMKQRNQPPEVRQECIGREESRMLETGIVAAGDICNTTDTLSQKALGRLSYYNFIELLGWLPDQAPGRYQAGKNLLSQFAEETGDPVHLSLNPHAPYSVSDMLWKLMESDFKEKTITIHNQESIAENDFFQTGTGDLERMFAGLNISNSHFKATGRRSPSLFLKKLKTAGQILLVHNTYMNEQDLTESLDFSSSLFFCFCPNANRYIEDRLPEIPLFTRHKAKIVLGTDSLASNHQLNILEEIKTIKAHFPFIPTAEMLVWATSNGAKALSFDDKFGDFGVGKKPGIVLIENLKKGEITAGSTSRRLL